MAGNDFMVDDVKEILLYCGGQAQPQVPKAPVYS